jgi:hypothetical protein
MKGELNMYYFVCGYLEDGTEYEKQYKTKEEAERNAAFLNEQGCNVWPEEVE